MRTPARFLCVVLTALAVPIAGCDRYPQDPRHTLAEALARDTLRIGVIAAAPWITGEPPGVPGGPEAALLRDLADSLGVAVDWQWGTEAELLEALAHYELDVVAGGIVASTPWKAHVALTLPYYTSHTVVGIPAAASIPEGLAMPVAVRPASGLRDALDDRGLEVQVREDLRGVDGPVAAELWEVEGMGLRNAHVRLRTERHVMAVPPGENAMLMRLEDALLRVDPDAFADHLWEAARP